MLGVLTGAVAGLATVTPAAGYIQPWAAAVIGLLSAGVCYIAVQVRMKLDWDDALDVWGVHRVGGILGSICVGIFAVSSVNGVSGLLQGNVHQFLVHILGVPFTTFYSFVVTYLILKLINTFGGVRVSEEEEKEGLDAMLLGESAYDL